MKLARKLVVSLFAISFIFAAACGGDDGDGKAPATKQDNKGTPSTTPEKKQNSSEAECSETKMCPEGFICLGVAGNKCIPTCKDDSACTKNGEKCMQLPPNHIAGNYTETKVCNNPSGMPTSSDKLKDCDENHRCKAEYFCHQTKKCYKSCTDYDSCPTGLMPDKSASPGEKQGAGCLPTTNPTLKQMKFVLGDYPNEKVCFTGAGKDKNSAHIVVSAAP